MGGKSWRSRGALWILLIPSALWGCREKPPESVPAKRETPTAAVEVEIDPTPGTCVEGELAAGESRVYSLVLGAGEYLGLDVEQQGVDVQVTVREPSSSLQLIFDSPTGDEGTETVSLVTVNAGKHLFEITAESGDRGGRYQVCVKTRRRATDSDRLCDRASRAYYSVRYNHGLTCHRKAEGFQEAARLWADCGDKPRHADALFRLGLTLTDSEECRKLDDADAAYTRALDLFRQIDDKTYEAHTLDRRADVRIDLGEPHLARQDYAAALELWRQLERPRDEASALHGLGRAAVPQGRIRDAVERYRQALEIWKRIDDPCSAATTRTDLGTAYALFGEIRHAEDQYNEALSLLDRCRNPKQKAITLTKVGDLLSNAKKFDEALAKYREALVLRKGRRGRAVTLNSIGLAEARAGRASRAYEAFRSSLEIFRELGEPKKQATVLGNLARLHRGDKNFSQAREYLEESLTLALDAGHREAEALALLGLARLERRENDFEEARRYAEEAIDVVEQARGVIDHGDVRSAYMAKRQDYYDFLIDVLVRRDPSRGSAARAFEVADRARARSLLDAISAEGTASAATEEAAELTAALNSAHLSWLRISQSGDIEEMKRIEVELRELLERLRIVNSEPSEDRPAPAAPFFPPLDQIRDQVLDDETLLLAYHLSPKSGYLWAMTPTGLTVHEIAGRNEIDRVAKQARKALRRRGAEAGQPDLAELGRRLLAPVADLLGDRRLLLVVPNVLRDVPFAALPDPRLDTAGQPLGVRHEIVYLPSLAVLWALRERAARRTPGERAAAAVADPVFGPYDPRAAASVSPVLPALDPLPETRDEAQAVRQSLGEPFHGFVGFEARRQLFFGGELTGLRLLHLATHSLLDVTDPDAPEVRFPVPEPSDLAALVFSRVDRGGRAVDGYLRAYEIRRLDLPADLVVLSACRTALGEEVRGEGLIGLSRAFLAAGARQVLASLWEVDDRATAALMERFYAGLRDGLPASRALRDAQAATRQDESRQAPYFWAGFVLQGDWTAAGLAKPPD